MAGLGITARWRAHGVMCGGLVCRCTSTGRPGAGAAHPRVCVRARARARACVCVCVCVCVAVPTTESSAMFCGQAHPIVLGPATSSVSSDYVGPARAIVEAHTEAPCLFLQVALTTCKVFLTKPCIVCDLMVASVVRLC